MPPGSVPFRRFELKQSRRLARLQLGLHLLAAVAALASPLAFQYRGLLLIAVVAATFRTVRRNREPARIASLLVGSDGRWSLLLRDGRLLAAVPAGSSISSPLLVWLEWNEPRGMPRLLILPDSLPGDQYRELRVSLRIAAPHMQG